MGTQGQTIATRPAASSTGLVQYGKAVRHDATAASGERVAAGLKRWWAGWTQYAAQFSTWGGFR